MSKMFNLDTQDGPVAVRLDDIVRVGPILRPPATRYVCFYVHLRSGGEPIRPLVTMARSWEADDSYKKAVKPEETEARQSLNLVREELLRSIENS